MSELIASPLTPLAEDSGVDLLDKVLGELPPESSGEQVWSVLGRAGLIELGYRGGEVGSGAVPERLGALLTAVDARFEVGATLSVCVQLATALPVLATGSGPAAHALAEAVAGRTTVALAATDTGTGSDLTALETEARVDDSGIVLTGGKRWITNATTADWFLVLARHRSGRHFTSFTWVLVPSSAPGVRVRPAETDLFGGSGAGHVDFDAVHLDRGHVVGRLGRGLASFARHIATERLAGALWSVALCRRTLQYTLRWLTARPNGDGTLWDLGSVRQRFATCLVRIRELDALANELADGIVTGRDSSAAALLKAAVGTTVDGVLAECAQLQGAEGFTATGAQRLRAQAGIFGIGGGTTELVLSAVADDAESLLADLGSPPWSRTTG